MINFLESRLCCFYSIIFLFRLRGLNEFALIGSMDPEGYQGKIARGVVTSDFDAVLLKWMWARFEVGRGTLYLHVVVVWRNVSGFVTLPSLL